MRMHQPMRTAAAAAVALALTALAPLSLQAQARAMTQRAVDERELLRLEDQWAQALIKRDADFFRRTLHRANGRWRVETDEPGWRQRAPRSGSTSALPRWSSA